MAAGYGGDIRQAVVVALESQGADALTVISDGMRNLEQRQQAVSDQFAQGSLRAEQFIKQTQSLQAEIVKLGAMYEKAAGELGDWAALQAKLGQMEQDSASNSADAQKTTAAARAHGTQSINDFTAAVKAAAAAADREDTELEQLNQGLQSNAQHVGMATRATREQIQALRDMGIIQDAVTAKVARGNGQFGGFATAADQAADKSKRLGLNMLNVSYAIQDLQYGFGAVVNNIPSVAQAFGAGAGLAGVVAVAGVGISVLVNNIGKLNIGLDAGHIKTAAEEMKYLGDMTLRTADQEERLLKLKDRERNAAEQAKKPAAEQASIDAFNKAISEGPSGVEGFVSANFKQIDQMVGADQRVSGSGLPFGQVGLEQQLHAAQTTGGVGAPARIRKVLDQIEAVRAEKVRDFLADAAKDPKMIGLIADRAEGAGTQLGGDGAAKGFAEKLREATPARIEAARKIDEEYQEAIDEGEESIRQVKDFHKGARDKAKANAADDSRRAGQAAGAIFPGLQDKLQSALYAAIQGGASPEAAMKGERAGVIGVARGRGVGEDIVSDVAQKILEKAADSARNLILSGEKPKLEVNAERQAVRDAARQEREGIAGARAIGKQGLRQRQRAYAGEFQRETGANDAMALEAGKRIEAMVGKGTAPQAAMGSVFKQMLSELRRNGQINAQRQAELLEIKGFVEEAVQVLGQLNHKATASARQHARNTIRRPTLLPSF